MLGVEHDLAPVVLHVGDAVTDHGQILVVRRRQHLGDVVVQLLPTRVTTGVCASSSARRLASSSHEFRVTVLPKAARRVCPSLRRLALAKKSRPSG